MSWAAVSVVLHMEFAGLIRDMPNLGMSEPAAEELVDRGRSGLWHFEEWRNWPLPWVLEAPNAEDPTGRCIEKP